MPVSSNVFNSLFTLRFVQRFSQNLSVNLFAVCLSKHKLFIKILFSSLNTMLIVVWLANAAVTSAVMNFWCYKLIAKVNNQKNSDMNNFICNQYGERHTIFKHQIEICGRITTLEAIRMQFVCIFFHIGWIFAEIWIYNFPRYCSNTPKVRWTMTYAFCSKFHTLSSSSKILRID